MEEPQTTPLDANKMEALLNSRVTRAMLTGNTDSNSNAMLPAPPPPAPDE